MIGEALDKVIATFAPGMAVRRATNRARYQALSTYRAAEKSRRTKNWQAHEKSADQAIIPDLDTLIARARQMHRDNAYICSVVRSFERNVVGRGITPAPSARFRTTGNERQEFNERVRTLFMRWANNPKACDVEGQKTFWDFQRIAEKELTLTGQCLVIPSRTNDNMRLPGLRLQLVEAEQFDKTGIRNPETGYEIRGGVEINRDGRPVAYWLRPRDRDGNIVRDMRPVRVPADRVIDLLRQERAGQTRGVSDLTAALTRAYELEDYDESERVSARLAACIGLIVTKDWAAGDGDPIGGLHEQDGDYTDEDNNREFNFQPGMVFEGGEGDKVSSFNPERPGNTYPDFTKAQLHAIAAASDLSYEQVARDFSNGNFSSQRQALLEDRRAWQWRQQHLIHRLCQPAYNAFIEMAVLEGMVPAPARFFTEFEEFCECEWQPDGWEWIDPGKEATAAKVALDQRLTTRKRLLNEKGYSVNETFRQTADEEEFANDVGIALPQPDPRQADTQEDEQGQQTESDEPANESREKSEMSYA